MDATRVIVWWVVQQHWSTHVYTMNMGVYNKSAMKFWSKCISMTFAKTATRNVAFKVAKMRDPVLERNQRLRCIKQQK